MSSNGRLLRKLRKIMGTFVVSSSVVACSSKVSHAEVNFEFDHSTRTLHFSGEGVINGDWQRGFNRRMVDRLVIDEGITGIKDGSVFGEYYNLREVVLPNSLISIGDGTFSCCFNLEKINLPSSLTSIGDGTFSSCFNLEKINLPSSLTSIGYQAFAACENLKEVVLPNSLTEIGKEAFYNCESLSKIRIPEGINYIADDVFNDCIRLVEVILPSSITIIGDRAFYNCESLKRITIPASVTKIGKFAFNECCSLSNVEFLRGTGSAMLAPRLSILEGAFGECVNLKRILVPEYAEIESGAFDNGVEISRISRRPN